jgi:hypothetical protein
VNERSRIGEVRALLERLDGVERVLDESGKRAIGLDHQRSGELVAIPRSAFRCWPPDGAWPSASSACARCST